MAYRVQFSPSSLAEYRQIVAYLAKVLCEPAAAQSFMDEFAAQLELVKQHPEFKPVSRIEKLAKLNFRSFQVKSYIVIYAIDGDLIKLEHIFHQSQDYGRFI